MSAVQDILRKWVEALRSGEYQQGQAVLTSPAGHYQDGTIIVEDSTFCCLGVICQVLDPDNTWVWYDLALPPFELHKRLDAWMPDPFDDGSYDMYPDWPEDLEDRAGRRFRDNYSLSALNDSLELNFNQIADVIDYFGVRAAT